MILTAIILGGFIISLGGNPQHDRIGFRYWTNGRAFVEYKEEGSLGRFLGVWSTLTTALFAYLGSELVGVCAGETSNPRRAIPRAIRMVIFRYVQRRLVCCVGSYIFLQHSLLLHLRCHCDWYACFASGRPLSPKWEKQGNSICIPFCSCDPERADTSKFRGPI